MKTTNPKQPKILYTAAKALIKNNDGRVLVLKQSDSTISGGEQYHPPGGIVEPGESLEECVIREVEEEIGVICHVNRLLDVGEWYAQRGDDVMQFIGIFYACTIDNHDFNLQESEVNAIHWVGLDDIDSLAIVEPSKTIIKKFLLS